MTMKIAIKSAKFYKTEKENKKVTYDRSTYKFRKL